MGQNEQEPAELPLEGVGARLRRAREASGLTRAEIADKTKIPERHLILIEAGSFEKLPARTYAVGFSRSYARAVGLDEQQVANEVRAELDASDAPIAPRTISAFEPGDPARVPSSRLGWLAGLAALALLGVVFVLARPYFDPAVELPPVTQPPPPPPAPVVTASAPAAVVAAPTGAVVFTSLENGVWVKFYDGAGKQLMQKQMAQGETYTVPADATAPKLWTGRPDALAITIGGKAVPKLAEQQGIMKNVDVTAAALTARPAPVAVTTAAATPPVPAKATPTSSPET